jgi:hypothetical protein
MMQLYWAFRRAAEAGLATEVLHAAEEYKKSPCPFTALRRAIGDVGIIEGGGTPEARFSTTTPLCFPQPAVIALELLKFYDKVSRSEKGVVVGNKHERVAAAVGCSHQAVRALEKRCMVLRLKPAEQAQFLALPFPSPEFQRRRLGQSREPSLLRVRMHTDEHAHNAKRAQRQLARLQPAHAQLETKFYQTVHALAIAKQQALTNARAAAQLDRATAAVDTLKAKAQAATERDCSSEMHLRVAMRRLAAAQKISEDTDQKRKNQALLIARVRQQRDDASTEQKRCEGVATELQLALQAARQTISAQGAQLAAQAQKLETQATAVRAAAEALAHEQELRVSAERRAAMSKTEFKQLYRKESKQQRKDNNMSPNKVAIAADFVATMQPGAVLRIFSGSGPGYTLQRQWHAQKGSADLQKKQLRRRSMGISNMLTMSAGGEEHLVAQMTDHRKANPQLYIEMGMSTVCTLNLDKSLALVTKVSTHLHHLHIP